MKTISVTARFDGKHIVLDEPLELAPNTQLIVTVSSLRLKVGVAIGAKRRLYQLRA